MSRIRPDQLLLPSVFDRLLDFEPDNRNEAPRDRAQLLRDLKASVRRDLENLLNTRILIPYIPKDLTQLESSLVNYGIPDFGNAILESSNSMEFMRKTIEEAIKQFETRFQFVRVELGFGTNNRLSRSLQFVIDGILYAEPAPEPVTFSTQLNTIANAFRVHEAQ